MSHLKLWEICIALDRPILVLEDDALLPENLAEWFGLLTQEVNTRCDILYLGYNRDAFISVGDESGGWCNIQFEPRLPPGNSAQWRAPAVDLGSRCILDTRLAWGTLAYVVSPQGASLLRQHCFPLSREMPVHMHGSGRNLLAYAIDGAINFVVQRGLIRRRAVFPPLVTGPNDPGDSDILPRRG
jgi:GR25 family glycosyltransferase involved in LPS biosynthesis